MKRILIPIVVAASLVVLGASSQVDPEIQAAEVAASGTVEAVTPIWITSPYGDVLIESQVELRVKQHLKGDSAGLLTFSIPGGTLDGVTLETSHQNVIAVGDEVLALGNSGKWRAVRGGSAGYVPTGHTWGTSPVTYRVNPDNLYVTQAQAVAAVTFAANVWNTQGSPNIQLSYGGTTGGGSLTLDRTNNVFFRNDASGYIAETYWWWDSTGKLVDADIVYHENYSFSTHETPCTGYYVEAVGSHEFGHMLGLNHSPVPSATMWPYISACDTSVETLDPDDVAGIQFLYPTSLGSRRGKGHNK